MGAAALFSCRGSLGLPARTMQAFQDDVLTRPEEVEDITLSEQNLGETDLAGAARKSAWAGIILVSR